MICSNGMFMTSPVSHGFWKITKSTIQAKLDESWVVSERKPQHLLKPANLIQRTTSHNDSRRVNERSAFGQKHVFRRRSCRGIIQNLRRKGPPQVGRPAFSSLLISIHVDVCRLAVSENHVGIEKSRNHRSQLFGWPEIISFEYGYQCSVCKRQGVVVATRERKRPLVGLILITN